MNDPKSEYLASKYGSFDALVAEEARRQIERVLRGPSAKEAAARVGLAFQRAASVNRSLYECAPASVAAAVAMSAIYGLMPGGPAPEVYLIPRGGEVQWTVSHHGLLKLVRRSGCNLRARLVFEGDDFSVEEGTASRIVHRPAPFDADVEESIDRLVAGYAVVTYPDGSTDFFVMRRSAILKRREASDTWRRKKSGPWKDWPLEMALKTVVKTAISRGLATVSASDERVFSRDDQTTTLSASEPQPRPVAIPARPQPRSLGGLAEAIPPSTSDERAEAEPIADDKPADHPIPAEEEEEEEEIPF